MYRLFAYPAQLVTVDTTGRNFKRGKELNEISVLTDHSVLVEENLIKDIIPNSSIKKNSKYEIVDLSNKIILPGLVESHTHAAFAGSRANEFKMKLEGKGYEEIAKAGGGINSTVRAVRNSSFDDLVKLIQPRINYLISRGITSLEIKSGYGLSYYDEIKLLQVINHLNSVNKIDIYSTFLGAHTFPPEYKNDQEKYLEIINKTMIPYITENKLAIFCDAFCESTAFSVNQVDEIFETAKSHGMKLKLHTDQFNVIGGVDVALKHEAVSADHLEVITDNDIIKFGKCETVAALLPGVSFFLDYGYAPARKLIENNAIVALATDYNPGSSHISDINFIMSLAALKMKMTIEETISAVTINAAKALDINTKTGSIEIGKLADFSVFDTTDYADIIYNVGRNLNCITVKNGEIIYSS